MPPPIAKLPGGICATNADCGWIPEGCLQECTKQRCRCSFSEPHDSEIALDYPYLSDIDAAMRSAELLTALESRGLISDMYRSLHPDAKSLIPEAAVIGWYRNEFLHFGEPTPRAVKLRFQPWTWEVNGRLYPDAAEVATKQTLVDGTEIWDAVRLVKDANGNWCWFFGRTRQFVVDQLNRFVDPN